MPLVPLSSFGLLVRDREVPFANKPLPVLIELLAWFTNISHVLWLWCCLVWVFYLGRAVVMKMRTAPELDLL
jgi:hypothetical protein